MVSNNHNLAPADMFFPKAIQFRESALPQRFSLPFPIIKYLLLSSPEMYQTLIKCCKFYFIKKPIIVLKNLYYDSKNGWKCCKECNGDFYCKQKHGKIDMNKLQNQKIWLSKKFGTDSLNRSYTIMSSLIPNIYRYDVDELVIYNQHLSYDELKFLSTGVKEFFLCGNTVRYGNGEKVSFENIIKLFSGAKKVFIGFDYDPTPANPVYDSYDKMIEACSTIKKIDITCTPSKFNVPEFYQRLKHSKNRSLIRLYVNMRLPNPAIDGIVNEILATETFSFVPPVISFCFFQPFLKKMEEIQTREAKKYH